MVISIQASNLSPTATRRLIYVLDFLQNHPLTPGHIRFELNPTSILSIDKLLGYNLPTEAGSSSDTMNIPRQSLIFEEQASFSYHLNRLSGPAHHDLFAVEHKASAVRPLILDQSFQFDFFETVFFHISRFEEVHADSRDLSPEGWLKEDRHILVRAKIQHLPQVDLLLDAFFNILLGQSHSRTTKFQLTHDVDIIRKYPSSHRMIRSMFGHLYHGRPWINAVKTLSHWIKMKKGLALDPYYSFDLLLRYSEEWESKILFLMMGGNTKYDGYYNHDHPELPKIIHLAKERGYRIGLHPSYDAPLQEEIFAAEARLLSTLIDGPVEHCRQHFLRFDWNVTPQILSAFDIVCDHSMGYNRHLGFRCGTGYAYYMYDFTQEQSFPWKEQPFALMESSLINYCNDTDLSIRNIAKDFLAQNSKNTLLVLNIHNSNFDPITPFGSIVEKLYLEELISRVEEN